MLQRISSTTSRASLSEASSLSSALALAYRQSHHLYQTHPGRCPPCSSASAPPHPEHRKHMPLPSALPLLWPTDNHITCTKLIQEGVHHAPAHQLHHIQSISLRGLFPQLCLCSGLQTITSLVPNSSRKVSTMLQRISSTTSRASLSEASSLSSAFALAYRQSHHLYQTHPGRCPPCSSASAPPHPEHL